MSIKREPGKHSLKRLLFVALLVFLAFNAGNIGRYFFPLPYWPVIIREAAAAGIDSFLLAAVIKTESNFNPGAVSVKGARGLMQVMPETGRWVAGQKGINNYDADLLFNPEINIRIGAFYVKGLLKEYNGNTALGLASYNAGGRNVKKWAESGLWNGEKASVDQIPYPETRQFIRKVLFYQQVYSYLYKDVKEQGKK